MNNFQLFRNVQNTQIYKTPCHNVDNGGSQSQIWKFVSRFQFTWCTKSTFPQLTEIREINNTEIQNEHMGHNTGGGQRIKDGK